MTPAPLPCSDALSRVAAAALSRLPVSLGQRRTASPHEFYRYPARFSPEFVAAAIDAFSAPGDLVADYFVGGGTTLVEARLAGRLAVGTDINSLSVFVSRTKTRLYSRRDLGEVEAWAECATASCAKSRRTAAALDQHIFNFDEPLLAEQREALLSSIRALDGVTGRLARDLARCVLLRAAQWAFDMRSEIPDVDAFRSAISENATAMSLAAAAATTRYRAADRTAPAQGLPRSLVLHEGLPGVSTHRALAGHRAPRLVLTSPPYPGVYVNYHRWKLRGRKETPLPYVIAGTNDGNGLAYYTMSARSDPSQTKYFEHLRAAFGDIAVMCDRDTWVVQVVGFNDVADHLDRYLRVLADIGFDEVTFDEFATEADGRLWRDVPGRRWWTRAGQRSGVAPNTSREVVLVHRLGR
jgi:hypothetical protein